MRAADRLTAERDLLDQVRQLAQLRGWLTYHTHDSRRSDPGFPDLVLVRGGRLIAAELKSERGRATPEQHAWLVALAAVPGVEAYLWRPHAWPSIEEVLR